MKCSKCGRSERNGVTFRKKDGTKCNKCCSEERKVRKLKQKIRELSEGNTKFNQADNDAIYIESRGIAVDWLENYEVEFEDPYVSNDVFIKKNSNIKLAILSGDKHFKYECKDAIDILEQVCEDYKYLIDEFIDGGDGINNDALSKFSSTEDDQYSLYDEMTAFEDHMHKIKSIIPNAKFAITEDNHYDLRVKKFIGENPAMKNMLKEITFPFDSKTKHGVPYFPFGQSRVGVIHGLRVNEHFAKGHSDLFKEDIINFHTHGSQHYTCRNGSKAIGKHAQKMWGMPSMCKQMDYTNGSPTRANTGFGLLWFDEESQTYSLQYVFVEDGVALLNGKLYKSRLL